MPHQSEILLACALCVGTACGVPEHDAPASSVSDTPVFSPPVDVTTLDPHNTTDSQSNQAILMIYNTLIRFDGDMQIVGDLAERWEVADDGRTWTFHLRDDVRFHDGTPLTADAVVQTFARVLDADQSHKRLPSST